MREMKESGIEWIGEIPRDWKIKALRYLIDDCFTGVWGNDEKNDENDFICLRIADFDYDRMQFKNFSEDYYTKRNYSKNEVSKRLLKYGDILVEKSGGGEKTPVGRAVVFRLPYEAVFANFMDCIRFSRKMNFEYAKYILYSLYCRHVTFFYFNQTTGLQNLNMPKFLREVKVPLPKLSSQTKIAEYLDGKCTQIDTLKEKIQTQINLLQDYKKSVITEAVTKGLDPNAPMKDSGIEWIGEIPADWDCHPLYYHFDERKNKNYDLKEQNLLSLSYGKIIQKDINTIGGLLPESFNTYNIVEKGDIIIRPTDLQNDKRSLRTGLVEQHGIITSAYIALKPKTTINPSYFHYLLHSYDVMKVFYNMGNGVRQGLNYNGFSKLMVFAPTIETQNEIACYLDEKCNGIDGMVKRCKEELESLAEYKKSLIYEYVTGKKEVPSDE